MDNLPVHMRITGLTPSNEDVDARRVAIGELSSAWGKINDVGEILGMSEMIAESLGGDGQPEEDLGNEVQHAVQKHASAFLYEESPLEVGVCAGMAALSMLGAPPSNGGWAIADVYSNALWSALAFQPPVADEKRERLRREIFDLAQQRSRAAADKVRERSVVPDMGDITVTITEEAKPTTTFKKATTATIEALRRNAALDREELDFLWWVQLNRSRLLKRSIGAMAEPLRLVALGIEAAGHLRRLPADLHYDLVLRTQDEDPELDLKELIKVIGEDRLALAASFTADRVSEFPAVFPLLHALSTGDIDATGASEKRKASTWGGRALLEAGVNRMCANGVMKL
ncbi:GTPase-associated system all-helical protein GASH [Mesorhizobium sp. M0199]|uniref:GTPase-associated system all-helical protein GASH n=1 Tax=Mesorhizobium sp. M0199 TaxID=2956911 RepID=UPI00333743DB